MSINLNARVSSWIENIKVSSFNNTQMIKRGSYCAISDNESSSVTLNKLAMNDRNCTAILWFYLMAVYFKDVLILKLGKKQNAV